MAADETRIDVVLLAEQSTLTMTELCRYGNIPQAMVTEMVDLGLLVPEGRSAAEWQFPAAAVCRVQTTQRLCRDLGMDLAASALAIELLDEIKTLRSRVRVLERFVVERRDP